MKINNSIEWTDVSFELDQLLVSVDFNPDLHKLFFNIQSMVTELSKIEVELKRTRNTRRFEEQLEKINQAIDYLEKLVLMAKLIN